MERYIVKEWTAPETAEKFVNVEKCIAGFNPEKQVQSNEKVIGIFENFREAMDLTCAIIDKKKRMEKLENINLDIENRLDFESLIFNPYIPEEKEKKDEYYIIFDGEAIEVEKSVYENAENLCEAIENSKGVAGVREWLRETRNMLENIIKEI